MIEGNGRRGKSEGWGPTYKSIHVPHHGSEALSNGQAVPPRGLTTHDLCLPITQQNANIEPLSSLLSLATQPKMIVFPEIRT